MVLDLRNAMPALSIVIPTYNEERYLPGLLACLKAQDFQDFEVIVADNASKDTTRAIAKRFGARVCGGGLPGVGRNKGAALARSRYLVFLDADVQFGPTFIGESMAEFKRQGLGSATVRTRANSKRFVAKAIMLVWDWYVRVTQRWYPHAAGYCIFATASMHKALGGFDESIMLGEDADYVRRASHKKRFAVLRTTVSMSTRRFDKYGYAYVVRQLLLCEWHRITKGEVRSTSLKYSFEGYR